MKEHIWAIYGTVNILANRRKKMHFQFLLEDQSSQSLIDILMEKLLERNNNFTFDCKSFRGIGGFTPKNTVKETKTGKLLNDLATYLRGFNKSLIGIPAAIIIIVDNDDRNTEQFMMELNNVAIKNNISIDYVFCVAIEEVEAWLLGDKKAVLQAYPHAKTAVLNSYEQDSICGTWEVLADAVYVGGLRKFTKDCPTYIEKGKYKALWAKEIGQYMDLDLNESPSFNLFISELFRRI